MLQFIFSTDFLLSSLRFAIPIAFAAFAALISNRAGIVNINIEGSMSVAAVCGSLASHFSGSWLVGLLTAAAVGMLMSLLLAAAALRLGTDSFLSGIALNTLATGLSVYVLYAVLGVKGDSSAAAAAPLPKNLMLILAVCAAVLLAFLLDRTKLGTEIKAVGKNPAAAASVGIRIRSVKLKALLICGVLAGLGGAYLSMSYLQYFSAGMVAGRGFIGIAAEAIGRSMPIGTALFSLLFGAVDYFSVGAQTVLTLPYELLNTLPYLMTILALILYAVICRQKEKKDENR